MPISEAKARKLSALGNANPLPPLPEPFQLVLSEATKARNPDLVADVERFNAAISDYFKKQRTRG